MVEGLTGLSRLSGSNSRLGKGFGAGAGLGFLGVTGLGDTFFSGAGFSGGFSGIGGGLGAGVTVCAFSSGAAGAVDWGCSTGLLTIKLTSMGGGGATGVWACPCHQAAIIKCNARARASDKAGRAGSRAMPALGLWLGKRPWLGAASSIARLPWAWESKVVSNKLKNSITAMGGRKQLVANNRPCPRGEHFYNPMI
jgi:hypothetical protein